MELPALQVRPANVAQNILEGYGAMQGIRANENALASSNIDLENKRAVQQAQQRYQQGDKSALGDLMTLDPGNAARIGQGQAALRSDQQEQMKAGYTLATNAVKTLQSAEPQQRPAIWKAFQGFAEQQGLQISPELQGEYSDSKIDTLNKQIQIVGPMLQQQSFQGFEGTGFEQQFANQLAKDFMARGMDPQQALLRAADQVNQSRMTWTTDEKGNQVARPGANSVLGNNGMATPAPTAPTAPTTQPLTPASLTSPFTPSTFIDQGEQQPPALASDALAGQPIPDPGGYVPIPVKDVAPIAPSVTSAAQEAEEKYPGNANAQQKFIEADAAKAGAGEFKDTEKAAKGKQTLQNTLTELSGLYDELDKMKATPNTERGAIDNISAYAASTQGLQLPEWLGGGTLPAGQTINKMRATPEQSIRNQIGAKIPLISAQIKEATGMSSQQLNSNFELQSYLKALSDPTTDYQANKKNLEFLGSTYGAAPVASSVTNQPTSGAPGLEIPTISSPKDAAFGALAKGAKFYIKKPDGSLEERTKH